MHTYIHIQTIHAILTYAFWGVHMHTYIHMHTIHAHTDICILGYTYALYVCVHMYTSNTCNTTCYFQYIHICIGRITDVVYIHCTMYIVHIVHVLDAKVILRVFIVYCHYCLVPQPSCSRTITYNHHHC